MDAEAVGFLTARAALFFTPHASLMQDVPCLPLSGPFADLRGQTVPRRCWTERTTRAMRDSVRPSTPQGPVRPAPIHDRYTFRIPAPSRVLSREPRYSLENLSPCPALTQMYSLENRPLCSEVL